MDFATRDRYRHAVEADRPAQPACRSTTSPARRSNCAAGRSGVGAEPDDRAAHVGYYLIDRGRPVLERMRRDAVGRRAHRGGQARPALSAVLLPVRHPADHGGRDGGVPGLVEQARRERAGPVPARHPRLAVRRPTWASASSTGWRPCWCSRARCRGWISATASRPSIARWSSCRRCSRAPRPWQSLLEGLEVRYLANRDDNLHFALLTDFDDAAQEVMPGDAELVRLAREGIEQLNEKYASASDRHLLPLPPAAALERAGRRLDGLRAQARQAGGPERAAARRTRIASPRSSATRRVLPEVRYVITLDTDTQLPRDSARRDGRGAGPPAQSARLRRRAPPRRRRLRHSAAARRREPAQRPAVAGSCACSRATRASIPTRASCRTSTRICSAKARSSARASTTSTPSSSRCGGFPENAILSHDLLEGAYARSALLSDVELYEDYPSRYPADVSRRHRWMRGDWQIAWWLLPWVPGLAARRGPQPDLRPVAVEDLRQPAPQPGAGGDAACCCWLAGC